MRSRPAASCTGSPSTLSSTGRPASRACATSLSRCSRLGCGARAGASSGRRSTPTSRRISASASRPVCSTISSASRSRSCSGLSSRRTPAACTVITLTLWPTTSWSSRAIRARSSATAARASSSRARSSRVGTLLRRVGLPQLVPEAEPDRPRDAEDDASPYEVADAAVRVVPRDDRVDPEENCEPGNCLPELAQRRRT